MENITTFLKDRKFILGCSVLLTLSFSLNFILNDCVNKVALVPVNSFIANKYVWNIITSAFYESNILKLLIEIFILFSTVKPFNIDNKEQFGLYIIICILLSSFGTSGYCFMRFFATKLEEMLIQPTYGFSGVYMSIIMFLREQNRKPESSSIIFEQFPLITYQNLPTLVLLVQSLFWVIGLTDYALDMSFTFISFFVSWTYLRFFYRYHDGEDQESIESPRIGNPAEDFSCVAMFPEALKPVTIPMSTAFYNIFAMIGIFPQLEVTEKKAITHHLRYHNVASPDSSAPEQNGVQDAVQERRRAKAMRLLDAKIAELSKESDGWGDEQSDNKKMEISGLKV